MGIGSIVLFTAQHGTVVALLVPWDDHRAVLWQVRRRWVKGIHECSVLFLFLCKSNVIKNRLKWIKTIKWAHGMRRSRQGTQERGCPLGLHRHYFKDLKDRAVLLYPISCIPRRGHGILCLASVIRTTQSHSTVIGLLVHAETLSMKDWTYVLMSSQSWGNRATLITKTT